MYNQYGNQQSDFLEEFQQKKLIEVQTEQTKSGIKIQQEQVIEDVKSMSAIQRSKALANIASEKELQRTIITFSAGHDVILQKECFGENIKGKLPIKILRAILFSHENDLLRKVLYVQVRKDSGEEAILYWDIERTETRWIRRVFDVNGISFGFGEKKENEIRRKILLATINMAEAMILSERHGWYQLDGKWQYAFPEEMTWKEVDKKC